MRKRWASRAAIQSMEAETIEVPSGDEFDDSALGNRSDPELLGSFSLAGGSPYSHTLSDLEREDQADEQESFSPLGLGGGRSSLFKPEGNDRTDGADEKRRKTAVQVIDDSTDVALPVEAEVSSSAATRRVSDLALRATNMKQFKFPWEKGRLSRVFGDNSVVGVRTPVLEPAGYNPISLSVKVSDGAELTPTIKVKEVLAGKAIFTSVVRKVADISYVDERKQKRSRAINLWWDLLSTVVDASEIGRKALAEAPVDDLASYAKEILDACFGLKSPGTLLKRYYSLKSYHDWCVSFKTDAWIPMTETLAWEYVRWLKTSSAPATKATSFMEACRFCWFVVGVEGANLVESSFRVKGASNQMKASKRPWRPADLLTVQEVLKLHEVLESEERHVVDRLFCGHMLHLLYGRARWSDLLATKHLHIDSDGCYLEVQTQVHKGAKAADTKSRLLPVVTPCLGIAEGNWAKTYMKLREHCGLAPPMETDWHMLPAPLDDSGESWSTRYVTSEEGATFLRLVLGQAKTAHRRVSTHSLKSTAISWASKFGLNLETRAILARHATSLSNPTVLYSRDIISAAMREFDKVLKDIRENCFQPDRTRSGMITPRFAASTTPKQIFSKALDNVAEPQLFEPAPVTPSFEVPVEQPPAESLLDGTLDDVLQQASKAVAENESLDDPANELEVQEAAVEYSETSEEASEESSSSESEDDNIEEPTPSQVAPPQPLLTSGYFVNEKSSVIHCLRADDVFRCGRRRTIYYAHIRELNGMRCSRCFNL